MYYWCNPDWTRAIILLRVHYFNASVWGFGSGGPIGIFIASRYWLSDMQGKSNPIFASSKNDNTANSGGSFNSNHSTLLFPSNAVTKVRRVVGYLYEGIKNRLDKTVEWDSNIPSGSGTIWYLW